MSKMLILKPKKLPKNLNYHKSVLLQPSLHYLEVSAGNKYVDATLGGAGHAKAIVEAGGIVLGIDQDPDSINACPSLDRLTPVLGNFSEMESLVRSHNFSPVSGIIFDLGVSSHQFDEGERGFSINHDAALDMRMDQKSAVTAADLVNTLPAPQLSQLIRDFGEENQAGLIAQKIIANRPITTTSQLVKIVGNFERARRVFQALRIAVNDELGALERGLDQAFELLKPNGNLVVISFQSLEDRIVKDKFKSWQANGRGQILTQKPVVPEAAELSENSRSHSAKLRAIKKYV